MKGNGNNFRKNSDDVVGHWRRDRVPLEWFYQFIGADHGITEALAFAYFAISQYEPSDDHNAAVEGRFEENVTDPRQTGESDVTDVAVQVDNDESPNAVASAESVEETQTTEATAFPHYGLSVHEPSDAPDAEVNTRSDSDVTDQRPTDEVTVTDEAVQADNDESPTEKNWARYVEETQINHLTYWPQYGAGCDPQTEATAFPHYGFSVYEPSDAPDAEVYTRSYSDVTDPRPTDEVKFTDEAVPADNDESPTEVDGARYVEETQMRINHLTYWPQCGAGCDPQAETMAMHYGLLLYEPSDAPEADVDTRFNFYEADEAVEADKDQFLNAGVWADLAEETQLTEELTYTPFGVSLYEPCDAYNAEMVPFYSDVIDPRQTHEYDVAYEAVQADNYESPNAMVWPEFAEERQLIEELAYLEYGISLYGPSVPFDAEVDTPLDSDVIDPRQTDQADNDESPAEVDWGEYVTQKAESVKPDNSAQSQYERGVTPTAEEQENFYSESQNPLEMKDMIKALDDVIDGTDNPTHNGERPAEEVEEAKEIMVLKQEKPVNY